MGPVMEGSGLAESRRREGRNAKRCPARCLAARAGGGTGGGAQTVSLEARFHESAGGAVAHPCAPPALLCGRGGLEGFGAATSTLEVLTFTNFAPETSCGDTTVRYTITLASGAGTLVHNSVGNDHAQLSPRRAGRARET
jgi:hypothetical protein